MLNFQLKIYFEVLFLSFAYFKKLGIFFYAASYIFEIISEGGRTTTLIYANIIYWKFLWIISYKGIQLSKKSKGDHKID